MAGDSIEGVGRAGRDLTKNSETWGWTKVTIGSPAVSIKPASKAVVSCKVYHYSGTGTFIDPDTATTACPSLPTTFATAITMPVTNLNQMAFIGTAADVVMIIWRAD